MDDRWGDHKQRLEFTERIARRIIDVSDWSAADLSCGDKHWAHVFPDMEWHLGDYAVIDSYGFPRAYFYKGPIEETIATVDEVDVFFLCETLEHLDDPDLVLRLIRRKAAKLILSTPLKTPEMGPDHNPQHYWVWDEEAIRGMLVDAGWTVKEYSQTKYQPGYIFQIWGCV